MAFFCVEADGIRAKNIRTLGTQEFVEIVAADAEVIIVNGSRQRAVAVVLPPARAPLVVRRDDEIQISGNHVDHILSTQVADAFQIAPSRVRMKITNERKMWKVRQKLFHPPRGAPVFLNAGVASIRGLIRNRVLDNIDVGLIAISKQKAEALLLVH